MIRNLSWLRGLAIGGIQVGAKLYEIVSDLNMQHQNLVQQVNGNSNAYPNRPPAIAGLSVTGQNGHFNIAITDHSPIYRGVNYFVEHADNPSFTNPHVIDMGASRNHNLYLGNVTRYWRAYSSYATTGAGKPAYFGSAAAPTAVQGGGGNGGPNFTPAQGSGTGAAGAGLQGPGIAPYRSDNGLPPKR
jgi:hypothetical protein